MKLHLTLSFLLIFISFKLSAQTKPVTFVVKAGVSTTSLSRTPGTDIRIKDPEKNAFGYFAGAFVSFNFHQFSVQPAVIFNSIAANTTEEIVSGDIVDNKYGKWRLNYIQVPVNLVYHFPVEGGKLFIGAGPYASKPLSGHFTVPADNPSPASSQFRSVDPNIDAKFGSGQDKNFKAFDFGINALAGFEFTNGIMINAVYNAGLSNIQTDKYLYNSTKIRGLGISFGYKF